MSYEPRVTQSTWPLFAIPLLLLLVAGLILWRRVGRKAEGGSDEIFEEAEV